MGYFRPLSQTKFINDANLVSYWKLDGNSNDSKGSNNGTDTSMSYSAGQFDNAGVFNGSNSKIITTGAKLPLSGAFTMNFWMKATNFTNVMFVLSSMDNGGVQYGINVLTETSGKITVEKGKGSGGTNFGGTSNTALSSGTWNMITFSWDGTTTANKAVISINGVSDKTLTAVSTTDANATNDFRIGELSLTGSDILPFLGQLDDIGYFSRALSAGEVAELYQGSVSLAYDDGDFGTGAFTKSVTGLTAKTGYRTRAYATNSAGTSYGDTVQVTTAGDTTGATLLMMLAK